MKRNFVIERDTVPIGDYPYLDGLPARSVGTAIERAFSWRCIQGDMSKLPKYVVNVLLAEGWTAIHLGGVRGTFSIIGLVRDL